MPNQYRYLFEKKCLLNLSLTKGYIGKHVEGYFCFIQ